MRLMIKFFIFILVLGLGAPFILKQPDGTPWMDARQFIPEVKHWPQDIKNWFNAMGREIPSSMSDSEAEKTTVYRWRAADGSWQFSDKPPVQVESETIIVDPNANLIQGLPQPMPAETEVEKTDIEVPVPMTISPDQLKKLKQDAENIQQLMDDRAQQLDNL